MPLKFDPEAHQTPPQARRLRSVTELCEAINRYVEAHNETSKPFIWTADPDRIIEKVIRGKQALESIH